jgi:hypothetical protein
LNTDTGKEGEIYIYIYIRLLLRANASCFQLICVDPGSVAKLERVQATARQETRQHFRSSSGVRFSIAPTKRLQFGYDLQKFRAIQIKTVEKHGERRLASNHKIAMKPKSGHFSIGLRSERREIYEKAN